MNLPRLVAAALAILGCSRCCPKPPAVAKDSAIRGWCTPTQCCWPTFAEWNRLSASVGGHLEIPRPPCAGGADCGATLANPYALSELSGATQSTGWLDAWTAAPSAYAVAARTPEHIAAAVKFASAHHLRLVVKGTGHDYLGRSSAPDSLLIWTHEMHQITMHEAFFAEGCPSTSALPAVTVEAGARWGEVYQKALEHRRYVQGGSCTSVGAAGGHIQGGGFGSYSKKFGTGAANMLQAEVVTADGTRRVANACQNQDLFWALRGGGGGTFGVVTSVTLRTHELPATVGSVLGTVSARTDDAFRELIERFLLFYHERMSNEHWGNQVKVRKENRLDVALVFQGLSASEVEALGQPFRAWLAEHPDRYTVDLRIETLRGEQMWDLAAIQQVAPQAVQVDPRAGSTSWWWSANNAEVSMYWSGLQSRWLPLDRFEGLQARSLAIALFDASRHWPIELYFDKAQAGAAGDAIERGRETSMNPAVYRAAGLAMISGGQQAVPGVPGREPDRARAAADRAEIATAAKIIRDATPDAGTYVNEADYFEPDWQNTFWGENYPRLLAIKQKYDPEHLFHCHHCVGSERRDGRR